MVWPIRSRNSSHRSGRLSIALGQPEAVVDEVALAGHVALVHPADLRHRDVRLVDDEQEVLGEVVEQAVRAPSRAGGRRCASSSSRCPSRSRPGASSRRRTSSASAAAAPPAACPASRTWRAGPRARARCRGSPAPSAPVRRRSGWPGRRSSSLSSVTTSPVSGCSVISRSISSPKNSIRIASSS